MILGCYVLMRYMPFFGTFSNMNRRYLLLIACTALLSLKGIAQYPKIYTRAGCNLFTSWLTNNDDKVIVVPALSLSLGLRLLQSDVAAVSITLPVSVGFSSKSDSYLGVDLPAMLELHMGSATGNNENASFGGMLGAGLGYNYSGNYGIESDFWGYRLEAGVSFKSESSGNAALLLISYGRGIADSRKNLIAVGIHLVVGYKN